MAIFPFYNNDEKAYTINDADYGCQKIIIAECDGGHRYATLCELIQDCPSVKQLTRNCIVEFLNNANSAVYTKGLDSSKWFLKVTSDGCLEIADPCICNDGDRYVAATDDDNDPGPLDRKVKGSCSYDGLYCIDIEEVGPQTLVWRPSGPNGPFINPATPDVDCDKVDVFLKKSGSKWVVDYECPETNNLPQYAYCLYTSGKAATTCKNRTVRYFVTRNDTDVPYDDGSSQDNANSYLTSSGGWIVRGTEAFAKPKSYGVIRITMPGVYEIAFSTYVTFGQALHSIRCGLYMDDGSGIQEINDIKYQTGEYRTEGNPETFNRLRPDEWDEAKFKENAERAPRGRDGRTLGASRTMENTGLPFARTYVLNITNPTDIFMVVKPDMRGVDPRLNLDTDYDDRYLINVAGAMDGNPYGASTTIEIARIGDSVHNSRMLQI